MESLVHPMKSEIEMIREAILSADSSITEGVKWNAPSIRTHAYFATTNLRERGGVGIILNLGGTVRDLKPGSRKLEDPANLLKWLAADRALVKFSDAADFKAKRQAFTALVRAWIKHV